MRTLGRHDEIAVTDDKGVRYALRPEGMSGRHGRSGEPAGPMPVLMRIEEVSAELGLSPPPP